MKCVPALTAPANSTNTWKLFGERQVENARAANFSAQKNHAGVIRHRAADHSCLSAFDRLPHRIQDSRGRAAGNKRDQLALIGDEQRVEPQNFAGAFHILAYRHGVRIDFDSH